MRTLKITSLTRSPDGPDRYLVMEDGTPGRIVVSAMGYAGAARRYLGVGVTTPVGPLEPAVWPGVSVTISDEVVEANQIGPRP